MCSSNRRNKLATTVTHPAMKNHQKICQNSLERNTKHSARAKQQQQSLMPPKYSSLAYGWECEFGGYNGILLSTVSADSIILHHPWHRQLRKGRRERSVRKSGSLSIGRERWKTGKRCGQFNLAACVRENGVSCFVLVFPFRAFVFALNAKQHFRSIVSIFPEPALRPLQFSPRANFAKTRCGGFRADRFVVDSDLIDLTTTMPWEWPGISRWPR